MANMSYCMYENTLNDLRDIYRDMQDRAESGPGDHEPLSEREAEAKTSLIKLCQKILELDEEMEENNETIVFYSQLDELPPSQGTLRYQLTSSYFIWRDEEHWFLGWVKDPDYYYQLMEKDIRAEAIRAMRENEKEADDSYGYAEQKNFD